MKMNKELVLKILDSLGEGELEYFTCEIDSKIYGFVEEYADWIDDGRYQHSRISGILREIDKDGKELERFNFGVARWASRSGSHFSDWDESFGEYEAYELVERVVPEHMEIEWVEVDKEDKEDKED
jgi:hypothetical protein